jgi:hypothetical protein
MSTGAQFPRERTPFPLCKVDAQFELLAQLLQKSKPKVIQVSMTNSLGNGN